MAVRTMKWYSRYFLQILIIIFIIKFQYNNAMGAPNSEKHHYSNSFEEIVKTPYYVDKTPLIKELLEKVTLITFPPGFGKSVNLNMLKMFLEIVVDEKGEAIFNVDEDKMGNFKEKPEGNLTKNFKLFKYNNLNISKDTEFFYRHCGMHPVIYCDFGNVYSDSYKEMEDKFRIELRKAYIQHAYLLKIKRFKSMYERLSNRSLVNNEVLINALESLSQDLRDYFKKNVIILIDNYNNPISEGLYHSKSEIYDTFAFIARYISSLLKYNDNIKSGMITSRHATSGWESSLNKKIYRTQFLESLSEYYGLTSNEVVDLLKKLKNEAALKEIEERFKGYKLLEKDVVIYNTRAVLNYLKHLPPEKYLTKAIGVNKLQNIFMLKAFRESFEELFNGVNIVIRKDPYYQISEIDKLKEIIHNPENFPQMNYFDDVFDYFKKFLFELGYFKVFYYDKFGYSTGLKLANVEAAQELAEQFYTVKYYKKKLRFDTKLIDSVLKTLQMLDCDNAGSFEGFLKSVRNLFSHEDVRKPKALFEFYGAILSIVRSVRNSFVRVLGEIYLVSRKRRNDITIIKRDGTAIIMQLKYKVGSSKAALTEIIDNGYFKILNTDKYKKLVSKCKTYIGLYFDGNRTLTMDYLINSEDIQTSRSLIECEKQ